MIYGDTTPGTVPQALRANSIYLGVAQYIAAPQFLVRIGVRADSLGIPGDQQIRGVLYSDAGTLIAYGPPVTINDADPAGIVWCSFTGSRGRRLPIGFYRPGISTGALDGAARVLTNATPPSPRVQISATLGVADNVLVIETSTSDTPGDTALFVQPSSPRSSQRGFLRFDTGRESAASPAVLGAESDSFNFQKNGRFTNGLAFWSTDVSSGYASNASGVSNMPDAGANIPDAAYRINVSSTSSPSRIAGIVGSTSIADMIAIPPDRVVRLSFDALLSSVDGTGNILRKEMIWHDSSGTQIGNSASDAPLIAANLNARIRQTDTFTAPVGAAYGRIAVHVVTPSGAAGAPQGASLYMTNFVTRYPVPWNVGDTVARTGMGDGNDDIDVLRALTPMTRSGLHSATLATYLGFATYANGYGTSIPSLNLTTKYAPAEALFSSPPPDRVVAGIDYFDAGPMLLETGDLIRIPQNVDDGYYATLPWDVTQRVFTTGGVVRGSRRSTTAGWYGTAFDPTAGAHAIVRTGGPLEDLVGERILLTRRVAGRDRSVAVYVHEERNFDDDIPEQILITPRAFLTIGNLALDFARVSVDVLA